MTSALLGQNASSPSAHAGSPSDLALPPLSEEFRRTTAHTQPDLGSAYATFLRIQDAFRNRDPHLLAEVSAFPLRLYESGKTNGRLRVLRDRAALMAQADKIFIEQMRRVVLAQSFGDLFVNWKGYMFGNGELWFNGRCLDQACMKQDFRVVTINLDALRLERSR